MTRKKFSEEDILGILRQIELELADGSNVEMAVRTVRISDAMYYKWRKTYGGMGKSKLHELEIILPRKDLSSKGLEEKRSDYLDWVIETLPLLETSIIAAFEDFNSVSVMESSSPPGVSEVASQPDERSQAENPPLDRPSV